ncbi:MAG: hypothetical protein IPM13_19460 [Phycisphaerales bacterium]|nr:hypothetical protein [Phycisphaerales bacterium]
MSVRTLFVVPLLVAAAGAQTYIVDAANGVGTHFRDLPEAVAAVPSGAVLRVRPGTYSSLAVANKSLTILGDSSATVTVGTPGAGVAIGPLAAHQHFELRDVQSFSVRVGNAQGAVHLESLRLGDLDRDSLTVGASANVHLKRITAIDAVNGWCDVAISGSCVSIDGCAFRGRTETAPGYFHGRAACSIAGSRASISATSMRGGDGRFARTFAPTDPGGDGLRVVDSTVDLGGACILSGGKGAGQFGGLGFAILTGPGGSGLALVDSTTRYFGTVLQGGEGAQSVIAPPIRLAGNAQAILQPARPMARLLGTPAIGSTVHFSLTAAPNELAILVLGLRPACVQWPSLVGFRDILAMPDVALGPFQTDASGAYSHPLTIPTDWVLDRLVWAQYFTFPGLVLPTLASNSVTLVVKS